MWPFEQHIKILTVYKLHLFENALFRAASSNPGLDLWVQGAFMEGRGIQEELMPTRKKKLRGLI